LPLGEEPDMEELRFSRAGGTFLLEAEQFVPQPIERVFAFFSDARNLERLTPPSLSFEILSKTPITMRAGALIDYRLRLHGLPLRWQSEIRAWEPPFRFVDFQTRGPYSLWHHEHLFEKQGDGTIVRDRVSYNLLGGLLIEPLFVRPDLKRIFSFRQEVLKQLFAASEAPSAAAA
jgi:ligand-binding SRPBCC domain-containing protein